MSKLMFEDLTYKIIGAAMEVHKILGRGFLESVYEESLAYEFKKRKIGFERQKSLPIHYKEIIAKECICDFLIEDKIILEIKAIKKLTEIEEAQLQNYLVATKKRIGLLINFGEESLKHKRIIR